MSVWKTEEHALGYLSRSDDVPHRSEGEAVLLEQLPESIYRILDLGTGDGRLLELIRRSHPQASGVALDFSPPMLQKSRERFANEPAVQVIEHDLSEPLPDLGTFDLIVSGIAIHHLDDDRKRELYGEVFGLLEPSGVFLNLDRVDSPTPGLRRRFLRAMGRDSGQEPEDSPDLPTDPWTQLDWLREIGFTDVDCYWKWLEFALLGGVKPG